MAYVQFDHTFQIKLSSWIPFRSGYHTFFSQNEIDMLAQSDKSFNSVNRIIALLSFENDYAALGGLAVVTRYLPKILAKSNEQVVFFTPFHTNNKAIREAAKKGIFAPRFTLNFECGDTLRQVTCLEDTTAQFPSYYLKIDGLFEAEEHPYHYADPSNLLIDSLGFCAALPFVCAALGLKSNVLFHGHDWETAAIALTSKQAILTKLLTSAKTVLTLHNSYDSPIPPVIMQQFYKKTLPTHTVLQTFIPLLNGPLTTVSTPFAHELRADPLQRGYFTGHLQDAFGQNPPIGIENGAFLDQTPPFPSTVISGNRKKGISLVISQKQEWRSELRAIVKTYKNDQIIGKLSFPKNDANVPVFFVSGRLDLMQKGFDSIFSAFLRLKRGSAKLLFSPNCVSSIDACVDLDFFKTIAENCKGDLAIWPFRIPQKEYAALVRGASFLIMPSLYEPFGSATEGLLCGTPVIARATGGLWIQINPVDAENLHVPQFYGSLLSQLTKQLAPTGILYRERFPDSLSEIEWARIFNTPLVDRAKSPLFESVVEAAHSAMKTAIDIYKDPEQYASLIVNGVNSLGAFSWEHAVSKYRKVYDAASHSAV